MNKKELEENNEPERRCIIDGKYFEPDQNGYATLNTLCGRQIRTSASKMHDGRSYSEWAFTDPTHAVLTGIGGSSIYVCEKCADAGIEALRRLK